ncbi:hypothetical protein CHELA1G11_11291 [Hyphomicrobiales bacterium]|nr:hypothetical protein CHELA1G11_11291 [Hyphomicrobiales bacterium]CAH1668794.1 hypothetical protein CHELA1G2_13018 [Hyphomicrobiales bacterium]
MAGHEAGLDRRYRRHPAGTHPPWPLCRDHRRARRHADTARHRPLSGGARPSCGLLARRSCTEGSAGGALIGAALRFTILRVEMADAIKPEQVRPSRIGSGEIVSKGEHHGGLERPAVSEVRGRAHAAFRRSPGTGLARQGPARGRSRLRPGQLHGIARGALSRR